MNENQQMLLINRAFLVSIINTLKTLDVRGYTSNERLVGVVKDLQEFVVNNTPLGITLDGVVSTDPKG